MLPAHRRLAQDVGELLGVDEAVAVLEGVLRNLAGKAELDQSPVVVPTQSERPASTSEVATPLSANIMANVQTGAFRFISMFLLPM